MKKMIEYLWKKIGTKYGLVILVFVPWICFFDNNNVMQQISNSEKLQQLTEQKDYLKQKIASDQQKIEELQTDQDNLEKFAREQFLMKKADEDVYVIVEQ